MSVEAWSPAHGEPRSVKPTAVPGAEIIELTAHEDERGTLTEMVRDRWFAEPPVQWNVVTSVAGTLRGVHWHNGHADLISVVAGRVLVALVDLRRGSPAEGTVELIEAEAARPTAVWIPAGVAHGFLSHDDSVVMYGVTRYYDGTDEYGVRFDDPGLAIPWPVPRDALSLSRRDAELPALADAGPRPAWPA